MSDVGLSLKLRACGTVFFNAGVPSFLMQSGDFQAAIIDTGVGDVSVDFLPGNGVDQNACAIVASPRAVLAASGLVSIGVTHTSDTRKRFTILQEGAAGAASAAADVNFDFQIVSLPGA